MFVYFRKDNRNFSHSSANPEPAEWLQEFIVENGKIGCRYILREDGSIEEGPMQRVDTSILSESEFNLQALRRLRDSKLKETDWWAVSDRTMSDAQKNYRQQLRDITKLYSNVGEAVWPEMPS